MIRTERLYYSAPGLLETDALVRAIEGEAAAPLVVLDRTIFYPEGGGQPCDLGFIDGAPVASVAEEGGRLMHRLAASISAIPGDRVRLVLDGARRRDHSTQHTAQHLLSSSVLRLFGAPTVSFHLGPERCTIDVETASLAEDELAEAESLIEGIIDEGYPVFVHHCPPEDIGSFPLRRLPPPGEEEVRIVEIDGIDFTPCGGTHLSSTREIKFLRILGAEKYKGMTRLAFLAGERAVGDYRIVSRIARDAARSFGVSVPELAEKAAKSAERLKELESSSSFLKRERAALEAELAAAKGDLPALVVRAFADRDAADALEGAKAFAAKGAMALAASLPELTAVAIAPDQAARLGERLKGLAAAVGGRGGGGAASFRASFGDKAALASFMEAAEAELRGGTKA